MRFRSIVLPSEHGGWSLTLEPVALGLAVEPSWSGLALGLFAFALFLARTPLKLALVDRHRDRRLRRTVVAERAAAGYLALAAALLALASTSRRGDFWIPLTIALPLVAVQIWFDSRSRSRRLLPELAGTFGIGTVASAIALAGGADPNLALGLWLVLAARHVVAIPLVRTQLHRAKGQPWRLRHVVVAAGLGLAVAATGASSGLLPTSSLAAIGILAVDALAAMRRPVPRAVVIGIQQTVLGLIVVILTALGVHLGG